MSSAYDYETSDPTFCQDLQESCDAVCVAAKWLLAHGFPVVTRPSFVRPEIEDMADYGDDGDLEIIQRVEVKRRPKMNFETVDDFPFDTLIVDVCHTWDKAKQKPYLYIILNAQMTAAFLVWGRTSSKWIKTERFDWQKQRNRKFYECPLSLTQFIRINDQ